LKPGGVITVSGQAISLSPTGNAVIINGNTQTTPTTFATTTVVTSVNIAGQTLTAGGRVTVGGDVLSLAPSGTGIIVIGTVTVGVGESAATGTSGKKNAGQRTTSGSYSTLLQVSSVLLEPTKILYFKRIGPHLGMGGIGKHWAAFRRWQRCIAFRIPCRYKIYKIESDVFIH
jgi:hypothetical protein